MRARPAVATIALAALTVVPAACADARTRREISCSGGSSARIARPSSSASPPGTTIAVAPDGSRVYVGGYAMGDRSWDATVQAIDAATGATSWVAAYSQINDEYATALAASPDGSAVAMVGYTNAGPSSWDAFTAVFDATTGVPTWSDAYDFSRQADLAYRALFSPDSSGLYMVGQSRSRTTAVDGVAVGYDAATGTRSWVYRFEGPSDDSFTAGSLSPDGSRLFVAGAGTDSFGQQGATTFAIDTASGAAQWTWRESTPTSGIQGAGDVATSPDGTLVHMLANSYGPRSNWDFQ